MLLVTATAIVETASAVAVVVVVVVAEVEFAAAYVESVEMVEGVVKTELTIAAAVEM